MSSRQGGPDYGVMKARPRLGAAGACRYVAHRPSDWRNEAGLLVCGVCHPPAPKRDRRPA